MNWKLNKQSVLWLIGVIAVGVATNAIWEFLIRPVLLFTQNGVLTLTTLGIQRFKDAIYIDIARGHFDRASEELFLMLTGITVVFIIAVTASQYIAISIQKMRNQKITSELNDIEAGRLINEPPSLESLRARLADGERRRQGAAKLAFANTVLATFFVAMIFTTYVKVRYIGSAVAYYDQLMAIATPYLTDKGKLTDSEFAQIKNRNDYERIILELRSVAAKNGQSVPQFNIG